MKKWLRRAWRVVYLTVLAGVFFLFFLQPLYQGLKTRHTLMTALNGATRVRVIEHSSFWDPRNPEEEYHEKIYAELTLSPEQIRSFRGAIPLRLDYSGLTSLLCIFQEHHRVEIDQADGHPFVFGVCFQCGERRFNEQRNSSIMPWGWSGSLKKFISSIGLHPRGPFESERSG